MVPVQPVPAMVQFTATSLAPLTVAENCCCVPMLTCALEGETETVTFAAVTTCTIAEAEAEEEATDVAVTITVLEAGTLAGAVYMPVLEIAPQAEPLHPEPESVQVTAVLDAPVTVAANCCVSPVTTTAVAGVIPTEIACGAPTVTVALADCVKSASDVAFTVTVGGEGIVAGAV